MGHHTRGLLERPSSGFHVFFFFSFPFPFWRRLAGPDLYRHAFEPNNERPSSDADGGILMEETPPFYFFCYFKGLRHPDQTAVLIFPPLPRSLSGYVHICRITGLMCDRSPALQLPSLTSAIDSPITFRNRFVFLKRERATTKTKTSVKVNLNVISRHEHVIL